MNIFENTEVAFSGVSTKHLQRAYLMFKAVGSPFLTKAGSSVINFGIKYNLPFFKGIVKNTLFAQFCGGETRKESVAVVDSLWKRKVGSIFDYAVEGQAEESTFDAIRDEIIDIVKFAKTNPAIPFVVFKPTAFGRIEIYEKAQSGEVLQGKDKEEWERVVKRYDDVCGFCHQEGVKVMVDAEKFQMQDAVDHLVEEMMEKYNKEKTIVWNTLQMYRTGRMEYMEKQLEHAKEKGYLIGYKIVRGAYMEGERERAAEKGYPSPIQPNKKATDENYNAAIRYIIAHHDRISGFFGTHNEESSKLVMDEMAKQNLPNDAPQVYFGQLYGMSDGITFNVANLGYHVAKYLPYGPVKELVPYLTRRAQENTSVKGQSGRELMLIKKEIERRKRK